MENDFSIRKEIKIELKENLNNLDVDIDRVYDEVTSDELMLDMLTLSIYSSILEQLKEKCISNEDVEYKIEQIHSSIVKTLMNRNII